MSFSVSPRSAIVKLSLAAFALLSVNLVNPAPAEAQSQQYRCGVDNCAGQRMAERARRLYERYRQWRAQPRR